jgi:hypothetical protein
MAGEHELWELALRVELEHGAAAPVHIAEMVCAAVTSGYWDGVAMWKAVAARYDQLQPRAGPLA